MSDLKIISAIERSNLLWVCGLALLCVSIGCTSDPAVPSQTISYNHPLAAPARTTIFVDGVAAPFADNLNYAEYYAGDELVDEYDYYLSKGFSSLFNIDLNADSEYIQFLGLDNIVHTGIYSLSDLDDTTISGRMCVSYELGDTLTNINGTEHKKILTLRQGLLEVTKIDTANRRISGIFSLTVETTSNKTQHTIEGSFTDIFFRNGIAAGEVASADVTGSGLSSKFSSKGYYHAFGNTQGQGIKGADYFAIVTTTDESTADGYESISIFLRKPIQPGAYDVEPNCVLYNKYVFDQGTSSYVLQYADTNHVRLTQAVTVTDYDVPRQRISGTFDFTIADASPRSPLGIHNGRFINLFWW